MTKARDTQPNDSVSDMAGPETNRTNLKYNLPLPVENAPVYFGGTLYVQQHRNGFSHEETLHAQKLALHNFDSASVGLGRKKDWKKGVPVRNQQGFTDELKGISSSAIISDPMLGSKNRNDNRKTQLAFGSRGFALTRLMLKLNRVKSEE